MVRPPGGGHGTEHDALGFCLPAMQRWHPDKIASGRAAADPARAEEAKTRFQQIHEAYQGESHPKFRIQSLPLPCLWLCHSAASGACR